MRDRPSVPGINTGRPSLPKMAFLTLDTTGGGGRSSTAEADALDLSPLMEALSSPDCEPIESNGSPISEVLPYLFMGSDEIPTSSEPEIRFKPFGITHVINMATEISSPVEKGKIKFHDFRMDDSPDVDVEEILRNCAHFIGKWYWLIWIANIVKEDSKAKIFVHCKAGKSRSASGVIAYLMMYERMSYGEAFELVKSCRPVIDPNIGFVSALLNMEQCNKK